MAKFKLSIDTDDPEYLLKALTLAAHALDMTQEWVEAVNSQPSDPCMGHDLSEAIQLLTRCANTYAQYKLEEND
jgi:hypothetical protein